MSKYRVLLFDLDHTLWDYETNSYETLSDLHQDYNLSEFTGWSVQKFADTFKKVNSRLWDNYNRGAIDRAYIKEKRFETIFRKLGVDDYELSQEISAEYVKRCPQKTGLMPHTLTVLDYLSKTYPLFLLTNGFDDVQNIKLEKSNIGHYFQGMITSETCGHRKPSREIFEYTLETANTTSSEALMVGDNLQADIKGAKKAQIDGVYYNPLKKSHKEETDYEISCLSELMNIL